MSGEVLVALFSGTGIATALGIVYQIWKERHSNEQRDIAGDLTLGELFRVTAKREVEEAWEQRDKMGKRLAAVETRLDEEVKARMLFEAKYRGAQNYVAVLVAAWREMMGPDHPIPEPPDEYFPDSRKFKPSS